VNAPWVPVFIGSFSEVLVLRETLDAHGIPALSPDLEHIDTATQGGNLFALRLLVPPDRLEDALRVIPAAAKPPGAGR